MDLLKNLKSLFVVTEETEGTTVDTSQASTSATPAPVSTSSQSSTTNPDPEYSKTINQAGNVDDKFLDILLNAMSENNKEGFDYLEFKNSLQSLAKMPMDEKTRFQSAFAMAQTMGATPAILIDTADHYLNVLAKEEKAFEDSLAAQRQKQIGEKENEAASLEKMIGEKTAQILKLNTEIEEHKNQLGKIKSTLNDASAKIDKTKQNFIASYNHLVEQVRDDIKKMQQYLK